MPLIGLAVVLVVSLTLAALVAEGQQAAKAPRVGVLSERSPTDLFVTAFRQGLRELGYTEGQNIIVEYRYAHGVYDRYPDLAAELLRLKVDVLVVGGTVATRAAKAQTTTVPIVFTLVGDPVGSGLVASLARPGGNVTGVSNIMAELSGKQLELLKAAVPAISRVTVLYNPLTPGPQLNRTREAAQALAAELQVLEVHQRSEERRVGKECRL